MKFLSIDLETTGLDSARDQILEFGAVFVDTTKIPNDWPQLTMIINHRIISGGAVALHMNSRIIEQLAGYAKRKDVDQHMVSPDQLLYKITSFLSESMSEDEIQDVVINITVAGKNPSGFDIPFLKNHFNKHNFSGTELYTSVNDNPESQNVLNFRRRVIDPAVLYVDWDKDEILPDLEECKRRAGMTEHVAHTALEDAMDVAMLIYKKIHG